MTKHTPDKPTPPQPAGDPTSATTSKLPPPGGRSPGRGGASPLAAFALVAALLALAAAAYLGYQELQQGQRLFLSSAQLAAAQQRADDQQQQLEALQHRFDQQQLADQQAREQLTTQLDAINGQLSSQQQRLHALSTTDRSDWLLAEAEYLMRLASQRLLMGEDAAGAEVLLGAADEILLEFDDSALFAVRKVLAEDRAALRAAGRTDTEGLYLRVAAAATQGDQLRLFELPEFTPQVQDDSQPATADSGWRGGLLEAWEKLKSYVRFTRRDKVYQPLLAPEYEAAVRQNLRLAFEQAQLAVLAANQPLFDNSLEKARYWITTFYTVDERASAVLLQTIEELRAQRVQIELPDISGSLQALKHYLDVRHDALPPTATGDDPSVPQAEGESVPPQVEPAS